MWITRSCLKDIEEGFEINPVVGLLGPRQCGKSSLARLYAEKQKKTRGHFFDLENPRDAERLNNPILALEDLEGLIIIDEIQRKPDLFPYLRYLVDQKRRKSRILILGSASKTLTRQSSESLAGRISYIEMGPFMLDEVESSPKLWNRGGLPLSFLAKNDTNSSSWRQQYVATFLEKDLFDFGYRLSPSTIRRFWLMLAHYHGQILNFSELAKSFGISDMTARKYLEILCETFMIRLLQPWHENLAKRQVKAPKLYFCDSGLYHTLMGIENSEALRASPKIGASWEGFALEQIIRKVADRREDCFFWSTHNRAELDLLIFKKGKRIGFEIKYSDIPRFTPSMRIAQNDLKLDQLFIVTPKGQPQDLDKSVKAVSLEDFSWATPLRSGR